ncbi:FAD-dependent oxidoreductase [Aliiroseovarius sp. KMU-50]|uniref:FAD-dependent oxidoreductase n=1 Tax=Aliiroseovarius salicola TaxID=3009082 RepID=A0ABT4VZL7_9RHOB|nr:FAD-dependent oxidoreductase [Aliiroseovarius sp. KMU-50]MDA5093699.1 FAD-dependent oxidoreductase [Aliiroseovarius sp. KMU-50]
MRDPSYDILFQPVKIGPVTAPNRFYQVPHCTGMGHRYPKSEAHLRGIKAEGGWGVVSTQETEIHPTSDITPANEARLWDDTDIAALHLVTEAVHAHDSLAAIQLAHNGLHTANRYSRCIPLAPSSAPVGSDDPVQARAMDKADIREFRRWHVDAARRAKSAGFDIIYVYAGHDMTLLQHFLLQRHNHRSDEYGGSFRNRLRLFQEVIADTKDAVGDTCAVAVRLAVDELLGAEGIRCDIEAREIIEALAEEPDLWDVNLSDWSNDSQTSRFAKEGYQEAYTGFVKSVTTKPVVGVGRYTSPDTMVRLIKKGHLDLIGAARPSIADPFLPKKIEEGRLDEIRECIGCNICVSGDNTCVPMRCTQNPTIGEEWRRGWHPEIMTQKAPPKDVLVVGGGPAGLEAATSLIRGGSNVVLAEAGNHWGGRVTRESQLPGLSEWARVRDWRLGQLKQASNAELYLESPLTASEVMEYGFPHVVLATGSYWRADGVGRTHRRPLAFLDNNCVLTPDDVMAGKLDTDRSTGPIVIFDDDRFYMGSVLAELAVATSRKVVLVTPSPVVAPWSDHTLEQSRIQKRMIDLNVEIIPSSRLENLVNGRLTIECVYSSRSHEIECATLITVTSRLPNDTLWTELQEHRDHWPEAGIQSVERIGDCLAPGLIASAVHSGHKFARELLGGGTEIVRREDVNVQGL